ncbi:G patch domain and ankyrin repeat-containing protein 1 [Genypterus blacodes]|uniref:G patch domain and ankyrin repeat-containing protein 1 n=1 Tax=Genypterus blacodes TaxID=154954 RepID=UPI003F7632A6
MKPLNYFTPASERDVFRTEEPRPSSSHTHSELSGQEARHFYESIMNDDDEDRGRPEELRKAVHKRKERRKNNRAARGRVSDGGVRGNTAAPRDTQRCSERSMELLGLRLLRCAHEGDISGLKEQLSRGVNVNFQDSFFWTAVMCASCSGQQAAVRLLLQRGAAWVGVVDTQGRDAKDLALAGGHHGVLEELESNGTRAQRDHTLSVQSHSSASDLQRCEVCDCQYSGGLSSHLSSTLHQFSLRRPQPTPYYCLPPSSASYKMMVRCGWKPGGGLGPEGAGPQQPVATVLKRDHGGLGYGATKRAKVTHFPAKDRNAVKLPAKEKQFRLGRGERKEESRRKKEMDTNWERDFRASFYL